MQITRKAQKDWECIECGNVIKAGSPLFREHINKWVPPNTFCCKCAKPEIERLLNVYKIGVRDMEEFKSNNPMSGYMLMKDNFDYFQRCLNVIISKENGGELNAKIL